VERLAPGSAAREAWIAEQLRHGYSVHNHVWIPRDLLHVLDWINQYTAARWAVAEFANASPLTNEFILLLRRTTAARSTRSLRGRLACFDPFVSAAALLKRAWRGSALRRFSSG
jgi:hypothetical protein